MKELTPEQIQENWNKLIQLVEDTFEGERKENLLKMYEYFEDRMCVAPASGKPNYHYCHIGGYTEHVLHVVETAKKLMKVYQEIGAVIDFNEEELVFSALHHDLGKVGDLDHEYYLPQDDDWRRKKLNEWFTHNPELQYMSVTDRALWLLQHFNIKLNEIEYIGLKLADGIYEEGNKSYFISFSPDFALKSNLPHIIHQADMIASKTEGDKWKYQTEEAKVNISKPTNNIKEQKQVENLKNKFDELFTN